MNWSASPNVKESIYQLSYNTLAKPTAPGHSVKMKRVTMRLSDHEGATVTGENQAILFFMKAWDRGIADHCLECFRYGGNPEVERD